MTITELDIEIIADFLANSHDLDVSDLRTEFIRNLKENDISISQEAMAMIFDRFMDLNSTERFKHGFDHKKFTTELLRNFLH